MKKLGIAILVLAVVLAGTGYYFIKMHPEMLEGNTVQMVAEKVTHTISETLSGTVEKITDVFDAQLSASAKTDESYQVSDVNEDDIIYEESEVYDALCEGISAYDTEVTVVVPQEMATEGVLNVQFYKAFGDHPEWFWLSGSGSWQLLTLGGITTATFTPDLLTDISNVPDMAFELLGFASEIAGGAQQFDTDFEKVLYVHDSIVNVCEYDTATYDEAVAAGELIPDFSYTSYGCLIERRAVCDGYSKAFQMIMNMLDIPCGRVLGSAFTDTSSESHAWNYIMLDGEYYYVDVTWDDPIGRAPDMGVSHEYFCVTTEMLLRDHVINEDQFVPECTATYYTGLV